MVWQDSSTHLCMARIGMVQVEKKRVEPKVPTKKNGLDNNEYFVLVTYF